ncbi:uncharacterized protein F4822DRAFT_184402 [Hypoxylon trugodes]|uniref:uncharacterized protein n=1 Tax=Hypoxylon trugodes TaxID=326681 RepID=UPI00219B70FD|nr:uncharacterized protein F4822DRAFT_184402 [Hypoxylon trugodes]KAI1391381.1 hypothetical protein F4822DRAFT_184402 [Hypoxylon trugodes]
MEAVAVVGLASNILQFVEFTAKLIRISNELRNHRTWSTSRDHEIVTKHLKLLTQNISESAKVISQTSAMALPEEKALRLVADRCCELAKTLLSRLSKCGIQPGQNGGRLQRAKAILNGIWNKQEIEEIAHRLQFFRSELELHYTTQIRKTQLDQQIRQSTKEDLQLVLDRLDALESLISETVTSRHSEILKSIAAARIENARFESRAIQQSAASHSIITSRLDELECSIAATNMNVQNICARQSEVLESLAHVKVENREFLARITQQVPPTNHFGASFQHALKPLLEEYMGKFLAGVKKEYRGTARSEMDALLENTLPALGNIQYRTQPDPGNVADEIGLEVDQYNQTPNDPSSADEIASFASTDRRATSQLNKSELANIYHYCWGKKTSLGIFSLSIRDKVHLDESKHPTRLYELTVHFIPSPRWFSTGYSMTYHKSTDARGKPEFGLRLKTYRLLGEGHPVLEAIETNDILSLQSMLSQKLVSPSDQTPSGESLFHVSYRFS